MVTFPSPNIPQVFIFKLTGIVCWGLYQVEEENFKSRLMYVMMQLIFSSLDILILEVVVSDEAEEKAKEKEEKEAEDVTKHTFDTSMIPSPTGLS